MSAYVIRFAIANLVLTIVFAVIAGILKLESGSGLAVGAVMAASFFAGSAFAKDHAREPTSEEKGAFAWRALLATWLISLVLAALFFVLVPSAGELRSLGQAFRSGSMIALVGGAALFITAIYYIGIRWSFGWFAKLVARGR